jgi:hypothetical protein
MSEKLWPDHVEDEELTKDYNQRIKESDKLF